MRTQTKEYLEGLLKKHADNWNILDVGSRDEGSGNIRELCERYGKYTGLDMIDGNNVDVVLNAHELSSKYKSEFDLVVCADTFEHDDAFWVTLEEIKKVVKKGGWVFLGYPSRYCPEHNHPNDYWRFMPQSMELMFKGFDNFEMKVDRNEESNMEDEVYGWGQKT